MNLSFKNIFFALASTIAIFAILILAQPVLVPLMFALLISFILHPLAQKLESFGMGRSVAAILSVFGMLLILSGLIYIFSAQIVGLTSELADTKDKLLQIIANITIYINNNLNFVPNLEKDELLTRIKEFFSESAGLLIGQTVNSTATFITSLIATIIFAFLILIYREGLTEAFTRFYPVEVRDKAVNMFRRILKVGKKYLLGMLLLIAILGLANSIGLLIIGIDNSFLFGFLAAFLAIIPYVGTFIGAAIPTLYAIITYDSIWMPIGVVILFWAIQVIESNFLSPKVVGGSLKINALAAILSIIIGASVWGIAGMILFLPYTAMLRVICEEFEELEPIAMLIGEHNQSGEKQVPGYLERMWEKIKNKFNKTSEKS